MNRDIVYVAGLLVDQAQSSQRAGTFIEPLPDLTKVFAGAITATQRELNHLTLMQACDEKIH